MYRNRLLAVACFLAVVVGLSMQSHAELSGVSSINTYGQKQNARGWDASIRTFFGYNDNVMIVPDTPPFFNGDEDSVYGGLTIKGAYRFVQEENWTAGVTLKLDQIWFAEEQPSAALATASDANDYDMTAVSPSLFADYHFELFGKPTTVGVRYDYRWDDAPIAAVGIQSHQISLRGGIYVLPELLLSMQYAHAWDNFDVKWPGTTALNERDANRDVFTLSAKYWFHNRKRSIEVGYQYLDNNSEGTNFEYYANGYFARFESHIWGPLYGALGFNYSHGKYGGFTGFGVPAPGRQYQDVYNYTAQLIWIIDRNWSVDFYYLHKDLRSNLSQFESDVNNVGFGVTYKF